MKTVLASLVVAGTIATTGSALAQDFGSSGTVSIAGERVSGVYWSRIKTDVDGPGGETSTKSTQLALLGLSPAAPQITPRIGFDYFVADSVSLGGAFALVHTFTEVGDADADGTLLIVQPRVGYLIPLSDSISFWPRVGLMLTFINTDGGAFVGGFATGGDTKATNFGFNIDAPFYIEFAEHFGLLAGPIADLGFVGGFEVDTGLGDVEGKVRIWAVGGLVGVGGHF